MQNYLSSLGKGNDISDGRSTSQQHDESVQAQCNPAMRWCAHIKGIQQIPKLVLRLFWGQANDVKHLLLNVPPVDSEAAA